MSDGATVDLRIRVNTETGQITVLDQQLKGLGDSAKKTQGAFGGLRDGTKDLLQTFGLVATAGTILEFFKSAVHGASDQAEAMRRLKFDVEASHGSWDENQKNIESWLNTVQTTTKFTESEATVALEEFVRATGNVTQALKASDVAMGISNKTGMQLGESTSLLTDLINGNERGLIRLNKEFGGILGPVKDAQTGLDRLAQIYGNAATSGDTLADKQAKLGNAVSQLKDSIGDALSGPLTKLIGWATTAVQEIGNVGLTFASVAAKIESFGEFFNNAFKADGFAGIKAAYKNMKVEMAAIDQSTEEQFIDSEKKKTAAAQVEADARVQINKAAHDKMEKTRKEAADKAAALAAEQTQKIAQIESELDKQIAEGDKRSFATQKVALDSKYAAEKATINKEITDATQRATLLAKLDKAYAVSLAKTELEIRQEKQTTALSIMDTAVQTLQTLNALGDKGSAAERVRAKALLALQQAVAIGWIWVAAAKSAGSVGILASPGIFALAAVQTGLAVANFASESKAIDKAAAAESSGLATVTATPSAPGITLPSSTGAGGGSPLAPGTVTAQGPVSAPAAAGFSGGGAITVMVEKIEVNVTVMRLAPEYAQEAMELITDAVRRGLPGTFQFVNTIANQAAKSAALAS